MADADTTPDDERAYLQAMANHLFPAPEKPDPDPADTGETGRLRVPREGRYVPGPSRGATEIRDFITDLFTPRYP